MKLTRRDLRDIFDAAHSNVLELSPAKGELTQQEFIAKCYLLSCKKILGLNVDIEFPEKSVPEPVED